MASSSSSRPSAPDGDRSGDGIRPGPDVAAPDGEPAARCPYCGRPFRAERFETLHRGLEHPDRLSDRERAAFERASREERAAVRRFRLLALGVVVVGYFCMLFLYAIVT